MGFKQREVRIKASHSMKEIIEVMTKNEGEGGYNPGALSVITTAIQSGPLGFLTVLDLDTAGVYGSGIWVLWKYVCDMDLKRLTDVLDKGKRGTLRTDLTKLAEYGATSSSLDIVRQLRDEMGFKDKADANAAPV